MAMGNRFFAGFGALLFLVTSSALTVAVIVSLSSSNNNVSNTTTPAKSNSSLATLDFKPGAQLPTQFYTPQTKPLSHLQYSDLVKGTGAVVKSGDTITADYVGFFADNGKVFDDSALHGGAQTFSLSGVIPGWTVGIPGMRVGGVRELLIPSSMAYGSKGNSAIPPNSDLGFFVQVDAVKP